MGFFFGRSDRFLSDHRNAYVEASSFSVFLPGRRRALERQASPPPSRVRAATTDMPRANIGDAPAATFAELLSGPLLDIHVGAEGKRWQLHQNLLAHHSPFFDDSTVNGAPRRIKDAKIELPDEDPAAFAVLVKWLYQGKIDDVSAMPKEAKWEYAFTCQKLYLLCETIGVPEVKNLAIDQFRKGCFEAGLVPGPEEMRPAYEKTERGSLLRKLVSRIAARQIMDPESERDASSYRECFQQSPDFAIDVINAIKDGIGGSLMDDPTEGNGCRYHEHAEGETCPDRKTVKFKEGS